MYYNPVVKQKRNDDGSIQFRVRGTAGGNLFTVPYDVSARTASLDIVKLLIHPVISGSYFWMTIDIADFYLGTPLPSSRYEYLRIHIDKIPSEIMDKYNLTPLLYNKHVYFEIRKCMYGLPQAGKLSQTRLIQHLSTDGYIQCPNTPCLFRHITRDVMFSLVVDDFGVRYTKQEDADHLIQTLESNAYKLNVRPLVSRHVNRIQPRPQNRLPIYAWIRHKNAPTIPTPLPAPRPPPGQNTRSIYRTFLYQRASGRLYRQV